MNALLGFFRRMIESFKTRRRLAAARRRRMKELRKRDPFIY
jgi:hypothetical protein